MKIKNQASKQQICQKRKKSKKHLEANENKNNLTKPEIQQTLLLENKHYSCMGIPLEQKHPQWDNLNLPLKKQNIKQKKKEEKVQ